MEALDRRCRCPGNGFTASPTSVENQWLHKGQITEACSNRHAQHCRSPLTTWMPGVAVRTTAVLLVTVADGTGFRHWPRPGHEVLGHLDPRRTRAPRRKSAAQTGRVPFGLRRPARGVPRSRAYHDKRPVGGEAPHTGLPSSASPVTAPASCSPCSATAHRGTPECRAPPSEKETGNSIDRLVRPGGVAALSAGHGKRARTRPTTRPGRPGRGAYAGPVRRAPCARPCVRRRDRPRVCTDGTAARRRGGSALGDRHDRSSASRQGPCPPCGSPFRKSARTTARHAVPLVHFLKETPP